MKYQIEKSTNKVVGVFQDSQAVENWEIDRSIYNIFQSPTDYHKLNESLEWVIDIEKINSRLTEIDAEFGRRFLREQELAENPYKTSVEYLKLQDAENEAKFLREFLAQS